MRETRGSGGRKERHGSKGQGTKKEEHANEKGGEKSSGSGGGGKGGSSDPPPARKGTRERVAKTPLSPMQNTKPQKQSKKSGSANGSGGHGAGGGSANTDAEAEAAKPPPAARPASRQADGQAKPSRSAKNDRKLQSDAALVAEVRTYMKANKLSQVTVGQEARISQAVISQWLSLKYHGHNDKVDAAMRQWLTARKAGIEVIPNPNDPTSVLRPSRATTVGEKLEMKKRKQMNKNQSEGHKKIKKDIVDLQQQAAAEGVALSEQMNRSRRRQPESLNNAMGDMSRRTPARSNDESEPHGSLRNMVSPGNFAPVSVVGTSNLGTSQTPVEQPEDSHPRYSETPTPFYMNAARSKSPGKSPADWLAHAALGTNSTFQSWPGPDPSTSPVGLDSASINASELVGMSPLQSIAHVSSTMNAHAQAMHDRSPALARMGSPGQAAKATKAALTAAEAQAGIGDRSPMPSDKLDSDHFAQPEAPSSTKTNRSRSRSPMDSAAPSEASVAISYIGDSPDSPAGSRSSKGAGRHAGGTSRRAFGWSSTPPKIGPPTGGLEGAETVGDLNLEGTFTGAY